METNYDTTIHLRITLTVAEARQLMTDFDRGKEPTDPGKKLYAALVDIAGGDSPRGPYGRP